MAAEYPYTLVPGKLRDFLERIQQHQIGTPPTATYKWLSSIGYKSSNDRALIRVLQFIGFIEPDGAPTKYWQEYRGVNHQIVLASAIKEGYSELFGVYPKLTSSVMMNYALSLVPKRPQRLRSFPPWQIRLPLFVILLISVLSLHQPKPPK